MSTIKIPAGLLAVVHAEPGAAEENLARSRARGRIFVPPWRVWVRGPLKKLPRGAQLVLADNHEPGMAVAVYGAFHFTGNLTPAYTTDKFPYSWAPRGLQGVNAWLETDKGLVLNETKTEEVSDNG